MRFGDLGEKDFSRNREQKPLKGLERLAKKKLKLKS